MIKLFLQKYLSTQVKKKCLIRISLAYQKRVYITGKLNYIVYNSGQCSKWEMYTNKIPLYNFCLGEFLELLYLLMIWKNNWQGNFSVNT